MNLVKEKNYWMALFLVILIIFYLFILFVRIESEVYKKGYEDGLSTETVKNTIEQNSLIRGFIQGYDKGFINATDSFLDAGFKCLPFSVSSGGRNLNYIAVECIPQNKWECLRT